MKDNILDKSDFNLEKEYELFDVIYSISKNPFENVVKSWTVIGHVLQNSADKRCFEYELISYPIHEFISRNEHTALGNIKRDFISRDRNEVVEQKKELLNQFFTEQLNKIK